jgi:hypothetical protein
MTTTAATPTFKTKTTTKAPAEILPQKAGRRLWLPMFVMALMAFAVGIILAFVRADAVSSGNAQDVAALGQFVSGFMFLGFASVFAAISFAIARILGEFRTGGGRVQEASGSLVKTLTMPGTAKGFLVLMMMATMLILAAVVLHFLVGAAIAGGSAWALANSEQWSIWLEGGRRFGVSLHLFAIALGLATIIQVLRFQAVRIREVAAKEPDDLA